MKRVLGEVSESQLNARETKAVKTNPSIRRYRDTNVASSIFFRSLHAHTAPSYPILDNLDITTHLEDCKELIREDSHCIPFAVSSANTCSLTAVADESGTVRVFDHAYRLASRADLFSVHAHNNAIFDLAWSPDDTLLATASGDQTCSIIDVQTQTTKFILSGHRSTVKQVLFNPDNPSLLMSGGRDGQIALWDVRAAPQVMSSEPSKSGSCQYLSRIDSFNFAHGLTATATRQRNKPEPPPVSITSLLYKRNGMLVSASAANGILKTWDPRYMAWHKGCPYLPSSMPIPARSRVDDYRRRGSTCLPAASTKRRDYGISSLSMSADGTTIFSINRDSKIYAYAASHDTGPPIACIDVPGLAVKTFYCKSSMAKDGSGLLAVGNASGRPVVIDTERAIKQAKPGQSSLHRTPSVSEAAEMFFSPLGQPKPPKEAVTDYSRVLDDGHRLESTGISMTHDSSAFITISDDCMAKVWRWSDMPDQLRLSQTTKGVI